MNDVELARYEWARRVVAQHLGPGLEALWQATLAHRDLLLQTATLRRLRNTETRG